MEAGGNRATAQAGEAASAGEVEVTEAGEVEAASAGEVETASAGEASADEAPTAAPVDGAPEAQVGYERITTGEKERHDKDEEPAFYLKFAVTYRKSGCVFLLLVNIFWVALTIGLAVNHFQPIDLDTLGEVGAQCQREDPDDPLIMILMRKTFDNDRKGNALTQGGLERLRQREDHVLAEGGWKDRCAVVYDGNYANGCGITAPKQDVGPGGAVYNASDANGCMRPFSPVFMQRSRYGDPSFQDIFGTIGRMKELSPTDFLSFTDMLHKDFSYPDRVKSKLLVSKTYAGTPRHNVSYYAGGDKLAKLEAGLRIEYYTERRERKETEHLENWINRKLGKWLNRKYDSSPWTTLYSYTDYDPVQDQVEVDLLLVLVSIIIVFSYMWYYTAYLFVTSCGMLEIITSFFGANLLYRYCWPNAAGLGYNYFTLFIALSLFIIMGIGADDVFVYWDTWKGSANVQYRGEAHRLAHVYSHATQAMGVTSATTILSFLSNLSSPFVGIGTFGVFAALLVFVNYCTVCTLFPVVVLVYESEFAHRSYVWTPACIVLHRKLWPQKAPEPQGEAEAGEETKTDAGDVEPTEGVELTDAGDKTEAGAVAGADAGPRAADDAAALSAPLDAPLGAASGGGGAGHDGAASARSSARSSRGSRASKDEGSRDPIPVWFKTRYAPFVFKFKRAIVAAHLVLFLVFLVFATQLEATPFEEYKLLPVDTNFHQYTFANNNWLPKSAEPLFAHMRAAACRAALWRHLRFDHIVAPLIGLEHRDPLNLQGQPEQRFERELSGKPNWDDSLNFDPPNTQMQMLNTAYELAFNPRRGLHIDNKYGINSQLEGSQTGSLADTPDGGSSASVQNPYGIQSLFHALQQWENVSEVDNATAGSFRRKDVVLSTCASCFETFLITPNPNTLGPGFTEGVEGRTPPLSDGCNCYGTFPFAAEVCLYETRNATDDTRFKCNSNVDSAADEMSSFFNARLTDGDFKMGLRMAHRWDDWMEDYNKRPENEARVMVYLDSSESWAVSKVLIPSGVTNMLLSQALAWVVLTSGFATGNWILSSIATFTIGMIATIVIGLIQVCSPWVGSMVFQSHSHTREGKVLDALTHTGSSVLSGAVSTLGASIPMLFAAIIFFFKLEEEQKLVDAEAEKQRLVDADEACDETTDEAGDETADATPKPEAASAEPTARETEAAAPETAPETTLPQAPPAVPPTLDDQGRIDVCQDGGVLLKVLTAGSGIIVESGDTVGVNYVGRVLGAEDEFDRNHGGYPFEFVVGEGKVVKGWDLAICLLQVGARVTLTLHPDYGYGKEGSKPDVGSDATLYFDIELVSIKDRGVKGSSGISDRDRLTILREERATAAEEARVKKVDKDLKDKDSKELAAAKSSAKTKKGKGGVKKEWKPTEKAAKPAPKDKKGSKKTTYAEPEDGEPASAGIYGASGRFSGMEVAALLERERCATFGPGSRPRCVAASHLGDVVVLCADGVLKYGHAKAEGLVAVDLRTPLPVGNEVAYLAFNAAADAVLLTGPHVVAVLRLPRRAAAGGALKGAALKCGVQILAEGRSANVVEARWHAFEDDHIGALEATGRLRLWDVSKDRPEVVWTGDALQRDTEVQRAPTNAAATSFCWGGPDAWSRFAAVVLFADAIVAVLCPLVIRNCAVPGAHVVRMLRDAEAAMIDARADDDGGAIFDVLQREKWLAAAFPPAAVAAAKRGDDWVAAFATGATAAAPPCAPATLEQPLRASTTAARIANVTATAASAVARVGVFAVAYDGDARIDVAVLGAELRPSFLGAQSGDEDAPDSYCGDFEASAAPGRAGRAAVVESLRVSHDRGHAALSLEADAARPFSLLYVHSRGAALLELPWLEALDVKLRRFSNDDFHAAAAHEALRLESPATQGTRCRHVIQTATQKVVGCCTLERGRSALGATLVAWLDDGAAVAVNVTAARYLVDSAPPPAGDAGTAEAVEERPLSDAVVDLVATAAQTLDALPRLFSGAAGGSAQMLAEARERLEAGAVLPLRAAARRAEALAEVLQMQMEGQAKQARQVLDKLAAARANAARLLEDAAELSERAALLSERADGVVDAARELRPRLSRQERDYARALEALDHGRTASSLRLGAAAASMDRLAAAPPPPPLPVLAPDHVALCEQLLQGQMALLQHATAQVRGLEADLLASQTDN
ncbi:hypothetical protein M885DRAFT_589859 [Pelagophyceae sp. CCMP2097]|nr:hypothetical protein M885DRAFT_589859 [Pelagophyceae sp. CCMP2097]